MSRFRITSERFINPYNFVSINDKVIRSEIEYGQLSGKISCVLETLTPLFIPNTTKDNAFNNSTDSASAFANVPESPVHAYDFYSYEDLSQRNDYVDTPAKPIIPGSSIRGAIRIAFEAATNGCLSTSDNETVLYRRTPEAKKNYGVIQKKGDSWELVEAEKIMVNITSRHKPHKFGTPYSRNKIPFGSKLYVKKTESTYTTDKRRHPTGLYGAADVLPTCRTAEYTCGYYLRGENFGGKHHDAIMVPKANAIPKVLTDQDVERVYNVWRLYQARDGVIKGVNQNDNHKGYKGWIDLENMPVYYNEVNSQFYISPACITKEVFSNTVNSLLEKQGEHQSCSESTNLCLACRLFGMLSESGAIASRLMFKDATPSEDDEDWQEWYDSIRTLPVLNSPKVSATEFYMEEIIGADYYNYDYQVNNGQSPRESQIINPRLRGRKFYWHRKSILLDETAKNLKQRTRIRPVAKGKTFAFEIVFDRLSPDELQVLLWVLTFGEQNQTYGEQEPVYAHKLGHGKPFGYGSVSIVEANVTTFALNDDLSLKEPEPAIAYEPQKPAESNALNEYLKITNFDERSDKVQYPFGDNGSRKGSFVWFGINKEIRNGAFKPSFNHVLPEILDDDVSLPTYEPGNGDIGGNRKTIRHSAQEEKPAMRIINKKEESGSQQQKAKQYNRDKLKLATKQIHNPQLKKYAMDFIRDYETNPDIYKEFKGTYESIKTKVSK